MGLGLVSGILNLIKKCRGMLGAPAEKTVNMSTNMHTYSAAHRHTEIHKHGHTMSYTWTYVVLLLVHSPHSLSVCERGGNKRTDKEDNGKCVSRKRERREDKFSQDCTLSTAA